MQRVHVLPEQFKHPVQHGQLFGLPGVQCCGFLVATARSARVSLPLRHVAVAGILDGAFVHAADMGQAAWAQLVDLLEALLCR